MRRVDQRVGAALAVLGAAVTWTASSFPAVPGQKLGAGFLPMLIGAGLLLCGLALLLRGLRSAAGTPAASGPVSSLRDRIAAALVIAAVLVYIALAERLGFMLVAPVCLLMAFLALQVRLLPALAWALAGTLVVHLLFYKLLRVPLPWGLLRPFY